VHLDPRVRERLMENLDWLRVISADVANQAESMSDEELVNWVQTLRNKVVSMVQAWMH
jgi:two-component sensor histidine kinase